MAAPYVHIEQRPPDLQCPRCWKWDTPCNQRHCRFCGADMRGAKRKPAKVQADDPHGLTERRWSQR